MTQEEQKELHKKEELKDKLHRAYLQRKASGAQKRYEDKIKAAKKAEMDAKKNALRAAGYFQRRVYPRQQLAEK